MRKPIPHHVDLPNASIDSVNVTITCALSPIEFWAQYDIPAFKKALKNLQTKINLFGAEDFENFTFPPQRGTRCLAPSSNQEGIHQYYRVIVIEVGGKIGDDEKCRVFFVDYGWSELINVDQLKIAPEEIFTLLYQSFQVKIVNVEITKEVDSRQDLLLEKTKIAFEFLKNKNQVANVNSNQIIFF